MTGHLRGKMGCRIDTAVLLFILVAVVVVTTGLLEKSRIVVLLLDVDFENFGFFFREQEEIFETGGDENGFSRVYGYGFVHVVD